MMAVNFVDGGYRVSIFLIYRKLEWHSASEACTASHMSLAKNGQGHVGSEDGEADNQDHGSMEDCVPCQRVYILSYT